jgi:hypothetical protein
MSSAANSSFAAAGFVAGILGAIGTDAFISIAHRTSPVTVWQFIASAAVGPAAFSTPSYVPLGLVMHIFTALVWSYLYAYISRASHQLHHWVLGGIVWGIVVDVCMDALLAVRGALEPLTFDAVSFGLITNVVFFGLPVAWYLSRTLGAREH